MGFKYKNLPPKMTAREATNGELLYYSQVVPGMKIPLGRNLSRALRTHGQIMTGKVIGFSREQETVIELLQGRTLHAAMTAEEIVAASVPVDGLCGVYFLIRDGDVRYVGASTNVIQRLTQHRINGMRFDRFYWMPCEPQKLFAMELEYIKRLNPPENQRVHISKFRTVLGRGQIRLNNQASVE